MNTAKQYEYYPPPVIVAGDRENLSPREHESLVLTANGKDGNEGADQMQVKRGTFYKFLDGAQTKLNAFNKYHAVSIAFCRGIIKQAGAVRSPMAFVYSFIAGVAFSFSVSVIDTEFARPRPARPMRTVRINRGGRKD